MALGVPLAAGGTLVLQRIFDPAETLRLMAEEELTMTANAKVKTADLPALAAKMLAG